MINYSNTFIYSSEEGRAKLHCVPHASCKEVLVCGVHRNHVGFDGESAALLILQAHTLHMLQHCFWK